jgi:hypothetical protein
VATPASAKMSRNKGVMQKVITKANRYDGVVCVAQDEGIALLPFRNPANPAYFALARRLRFALHRGFYRWMPSKVASALLKRVTENATFKRFALPNLATGHSRRVIFGILKIRLQDRNGKKKDQKLNLSLAMHPQDRRLGHALRWLVFGRESL